MSDDMQTVLGSLRGYRVWRVMGDGKLRSLTKRTESLVTGVTGPYVGACVRKGWYHHPPQEVPLPDCQCGYYAIYSGGLAGLTSRVGMGTPDMVVGAVSLSGKTILGKYGVARAQLMHLEAFLLPELTSTWANYIGSDCDCPMCKSHPFEDQIKYMQMAAHWAAAAFKLPLLSEEDFVASFPLPTAAELPEGVEPEEGQTVTLTVNYDNGHRVTVRAQGSINVNTLPGSLSLLPPGAP